MKLFPATSVSAFFSGARFPVFMLATSFFYQVFLAVMIFSPPFGETWGQFVVDFRVWCFGYDVNTGWMKWGAAWIMLTEPILLQGIIIYLWRKSLWSGIRFQPIQLIPQVTAAFATIALVAAGLLWTASPNGNADETPPFPGERIRTALVPPDIQLLNQHGDPIDLAAYRGRVVLLTAIYSTCGTSCPMLMVQAQQTLKELSPDERADVTVMAISLDPENDTLDSMARTAEAYGIGAPAFQFLNGESERVNSILDGLNVSRARNETTGQIDHANIYFLIDRQGKIAYRLTLSERHQSWLVQALRELIHDPESRDA